jgi:hypothetical protein
VKAYQLMMLLLLVNLSISVVNVLHIYNMSYDVGEVGEYDYSVEGGREASDTSIVNRFFNTLLISTFLGAMAGAVVSYFTRVPADAAFAYSLFASTFWGIAYNALSVIWSIQPGNLGLGVIIIIFSIILSGTFAAGLAQLIRGGWKSFV